MLQLSNKAIIEISNFEDMLLCGGEKFRLSLENWGFLGTKRLFWAISGPYEAFDETFTDV